MHFDATITMMADSLNSMLASNLRGIEDCHVPKLYRYFIRGKGTVATRGDTVTGTSLRRAHNPILRRVPWHRLPMTAPGLEGSRLQL